MAKNRPDTEASESQAQPHRKRSIHDRLRNINAATSLKEGEHLQDLCRYRNKTKIMQVLEDELGRKVKLAPAGVTEKSATQNDRDSNVPLVPFMGGTVILSRQRGLPLEANGTLELVEIVDKADPDDYE